ncbi:Down syndrome cell adhesion molecule-like protein Dscam2, partial [Limulus polyphemus]|uniref:Down syndrome cell adhesion molecule-like protein Dscam2 n=4 Tax=Limulus polyphemus TaxID=6850 RepID=A0ABM1TR91_LIMPO
EPITIERHGPKFLVEPLNLIEFSNDTGGSAHCATNGYPSPRIQWITENGEDVTHVPGLRHVLPNGTLYFPPFPPESYRQDIHGILYRCTARNLIGTILSTMVSMRAVVNHFYEAQVYDEFVIRGNTGVLRCHLPRVLKDYVTVTSWIKDSTTRIISTAKIGGRYSVFPNGVLHIRNVGTSDAYSSYQCETRNRLTGELKISSSGGRLIIKEPHANVTPRLTDSVPMVTVKEGDPVELACAVQAFPIPEYKWFKDYRGTYKPVVVENHIRQLSGSLIFDKVSSADGGKFLCSVVSDVGEAKSETTLIVTAQLDVRLIPQNQTVDIGTKAIFNCSVSGYPVTNITWMKDGRILPLSQKRFIRSSKSVLEIPDVDKEDQGMYQCFVQNIFEAVQASSELRLG